MIEPLRGKSAVWFTCSVNKLDYLYTLIRSSVKHRLQLTKRFLQRKESELLKAEIAQLRATLDDQPLNH